MDISYRFFERTNNVYNGDGAVSGILDSNGAVVTRANVKTTDFLPISGGNSLLVTKSSRRVYMACFYDPNKAFISAAETTTGGEFIDLFVGDVVDAPKGAAFIRLSVWNIAVKEYELYETREWHPIYGDDIKKETTLSESMSYYKTSVSGTFSFVGSDLNYIISKPLHIDIDFTAVKRSIRNNDEFNHIYFQAKFKRADCSFSEGIANATITAWNREDDIEKLAKKQIDLKKDKLPTHSVVLTKRPVIQVYKFKSEKITNIYGGGSYYEEDIAIEAPTSEELTTKFGFMGFALKRGSINVVGAANTDIDGEYVGGLSVTAFDDGGNVTGKVYSPSRGYEANVNYTYKKVPGGGLFQYSYTIYASIINIDTGEKLYEGYKEHDTGGGANPPGFSVANPSNPADTCVVYLFTEETLFGRVMIDTKPTGAVNISASDIAGLSRNYRYAYPLDLADNIIFSTQMSQDPTEWGQDNANDYFVAPTVQSGFVCPLFRDTWDAGSYWLRYDSTIEDVERKWRNTFRLNTAYKIDDVFKSFISKYASDYSMGFASKYFNSTINPINGEVRQNILITPASYVSNGEFSRPIKTAPIEFEKLIGWLQDVFNLRWAVVPNALFGGYNMEVEHLGYYVNGGSYDKQADNVSVDTTALIDPRTCKSWAWGQASYEYNLSSDWSEKRMTWSADVGDVFNGNMSLIDAIADPDSVSEVSVDGLTPDIDLMLLLADDYDNDNMAIIVANDMNILTNPDKSFVLPHDVNRRIYKFSENSKFINSTDTLVIRGEAKGQTGPELAVKYEILVYKQDKADNIKRLATIVIPPNTTTTLAINITGVTPNDYIWLQTQGIMNSTGGIRIDAITVDSVCEVDVDPITSDGATRYVQNSRAAFANSMRTHFIDNVPTKKADVNGTIMDMNTIERSKKQKGVVFPVPAENVNGASAGDPDPTEMIKTAIGVGKIEKMSVNLLSNVIEADLSHDPEL